MRNKDSATHPRRGAFPGLGWAFLGVLGFSFTFPATSLALRGFGPYLIGVGRAAVAAVLAAGCLLAVRARPLRRAQVLPLALVGLGVVFGFPVLSTLAMRHGASASHAAVVTGLLPAATAVTAALRAGERPSAAFWLAGGAGAACVTVFALSQGPGRPTVADLLLLGALVAGAFGYAEGGRLARQMPGWRVISWALVFTAPVSVPVAVVLWVAGHPHPGTTALAGLGYLALVSMYVGFFAWYAGLARAGVARASQVQLAQPVLTLGWSRLLLGERIAPLTIGTAIAVLAYVVLTRRAGRSIRRTMHDSAPRDARAAGPCEAARRPAPGPSATTTGTTSDAE